MNTSEKLSRQGHEIQEHVRASAYGKSRLCVPREIILNTVALICAKVRVLCIVAILKLLCLCEALYRHRQKQTTFLSYCHVLQKIFVAAIKVDYCRMFRSVGGKLQRK